MVLAQDAAQGSQAGNIVAEQKYQSDLKTYNENLAKEKAAADAKAQADAKAAVDAKAQAAAEAKAKADALAASKNYYATTAPPTQWIYKRGGTRYENPAFTNYEANRPERIAERAAMTSEERAKNDFFNQYVNQNPYATGKQINIAVHHFESTVQRGMSEKDWNAFRKAEDANRALALRQSAGLKAFGNAQISQAQQTELARLGGTATSGPTKVSGTLNTQRVPTAPGQAAIAQPWEAGFQKPVPVPPSTPASRFAEIATPGVGMFSGVQQKPSVAKPLAKGESAKNRISPYLIPVAERSLIGRYSPDGKPVQGPQRVQESFVGYDAKGKPVQGAGSPFVEIPTMGGVNKKVNMSKSIIDGQVKNFITVPSIGGATQEVDTSGTNYTVDGKVFPNEKEAQNYIDTKAANPTLTPTGDALFGLSKLLDKTALDMKQSESPIVRGVYAGVLQKPLEMARIGVELSSSTSNLLEHEVPKLTGVNMPWISDRTKLDPIPVKMTGDEASLPVTFDDKGNQMLLGARLKTGSEYTTGLIDYAKKYGVGAAITGAATVWIPTGMAVGQVGKSLLKVATKSTLKGTIKNTQALAIENAPASVWTSRPVGIGQTVTQDGRVFNNVMDNPYGKQGKVSWAVSQGVEKIKNIKNPIKTPYLISNTAKTIGADLKYAKSVIKENIPKVTIPKTPQGIKDVGIKIKLAGEDLSTKSALLQRQAKYKITSQFDGNSKLGIMAEKTQRPIVKGIGVAKSKVQIGVKSLQDKSSLVKRQSVLKYSRFRFEDSIIRPTLTEGSGSGFPNLYKPFKTPQSLLTAKSKVGLGIQKIKTTGETIKYKTKLGVQRVGTGIKTPILYAKYKTQLGIKLAGRQINRPLLDVKEFGKMINRQDKLLGRQLGLTVKRAGGKITTKVRTEISSTKQGMFGILPEEYTFKPKFIVENAKSQALRNRFRTGPQPLVDFGKQGASKGQLGRGQLNNIVGDVKRKIGINPRKNFDIPTQKYPKNNIIGPKQPVKLSPKTLGNPRKDPMIGTAKTRFIGPRNIVNEAPRSFIGGVPLKFKPNAVEQLKQSEKIRKADRFKLGYKDEPTELQGKIRDIKSITGQTKQKTSAEKFDGIGIDKSKPINPTQGAPKSYIGKGRLDSIVKSAQATSKPKLGVATDVKRIAKRTESGIDKQALRKRREEMKKLTDEAPPSSTGGDIVSSKSKNQSLAPLIQKPEPLKLKKKLPGTPITEGKTNGSVDWSGTEKTGTLILPPIIKVDKKRKPITARVAPSFSEYGYATESVTISKVNSRTDTKLITGVSIKSIAAQSTRITPRLATRTSPVLATRISPILSTKQPQALKQAQPQKFRSPTPEPIRPKQKIAPKFVPKIPLRSKLREIPRDPPRPPRRVGILPPIILKNKESFAKKKKDKQNDFLGNTKLDSIEGLFRRSTIIHGDKRISKQVKKDKRAKFKERGVSFFSKR